VNRKSRLPKSFILTHYWRQRNLISAQQRTNATGSDGFGAHSTSNVYPNPQTSHHPASADQKVIGSDFDGDDMAEVLEGV